MKVVSHLPEHIKKIATDSRRISLSDVTKGDTAFVALKTTLGDGHRYVKGLYDKGIRCFVVDDATPFADLKDADFIVAPEGSLRFLMDEAGKRLSHSQAHQIVITGSNKKTTAKELIWQGLRRKGIKTARSPRTWNSAMGVALSLFDNLRDEPEVIITEVGIDAPGQAKALRKMIRPEIGVITGVTDEHDEAFASHADKVAEKIELVRSARRIVYLNNDEELDRQIKRLEHPDAVAVDSLEELIRTVTGTEAAPIDFSTAIEIRRVPEDCVLYIDSFTNDIASLPLSVAMAAERKAGRRLTVLLGDFDGDREKARELIIEFDKDADIFFFNRADDETFVNALARHDFRHRLILVKGATQRLINFFDEARHDTTLRVDLDALVHNYNQYRKLLPKDTGIIAMVKADAYGLGALEVSKTLQNRSASYLAVAVVDEGVALRRAGVTMPIIVLNPITNRFEALVENKLEPTVFSFDELKRVERAIERLTTVPVPIHLKLDTGMHRVGFSENELEPALDWLTLSKHLRLATVFSHLATADVPELKNYTFEQVEKFERMTRRVVERFPGVVRHLLNTAGIETMGANCAYGLARLGIGLYGVSPVPESGLNLRPVAQLVTTVIALRRLQPGDSVGYGCRGKVGRPSVIATVPIGYADGIDRRLGNGSISFCINGVLCPTIGNVCMDLLMLDVTEVYDNGKEVKVGDEVVIIGSDVPLGTLAAVLETIPYEILTSISPRVRRTYHYR